MNTPPQNGAARLAVVGGGMAGIAAAHQLYRAGHTVDLIECDGALGGRLGVDYLGDRPVMMGGKNIGRSYTEVRRFLTAMGAGEFEYFGVNTSRVVDGKLLTFDSMNRKAELIRKFMKLGSAADVASLLRLMVTVRRDEQNRYLGSEAFSRLGARRDHQPLSAYFGQDLVSNMWRALTVRMNGAEPDEMYLGNIGVNLGVAGTFDQLVGGVQPALARFSECVSVQLNSRVHALDYRDGRVQGVEVSHNGGPRRYVPYAGVVVATPAYAAADIARFALPKLSRLLTGVRYFPASVAVVEYDRPVFDQVVRAIAMDGGPCSNAGVYGINDLNVVRYTFSGRAARPAPSAARLQSWIGDAERSITQLLGVGAVNRINVRTRVWPAAYCAYLPFYGDFLSELSALVASTPGIELAGDYVKGAPLEACFRSGQEAAQRLLQQVSEPIAVCAS